MAVYWAHLFYLPISIIHKLTSITANFIWVVAPNKKSFIWPRWTGSPCLRICGDGVWKTWEFLVRLYCAKRSSEASLASGHGAIPFNRNIWKARAWSIGIGEALWVYKEVRLFGSALRKWRSSFCLNLDGEFTVVTGSSLVLIPSPEAYLPEDIISALHRLGIFTWDKIILEWTGLSPIWKSAEQIGLSATLFSTWDMVTASLQSCGIMCGGQSDHLYWFTPSVSASVRVKDIYSELITSKVSGSACMFPMALWETGCPLRMIFFAWLVFKNRNLT